MRAVLSTEWRESWHFFHTKGENALPAVFVSRSNDSDLLWSFRDHCGWRFLKEPANSLRLLRSTLNPKTLGHFLYRSLFW
jgi:hypothetical protein